MDMDLDSGPKTVRYTDDDIRELKLHKRVLQSYINGRITIDPQICNGQPTIRGLRICVQNILDFLQSGTSKESILLRFPTLVAEDIDACLVFAKKISGHQATTKAIQ